MEIASLERLLISGHPEVAALCLAFSDWCAELRVLEEERCAASAGLSEQNATFCSRWTMTTKRMLRLRCRNRPSRRWAICGCSAHTAYSAAMPLTPKRWGGRLAVARRG